MNTPFRPFVKLTKGFPLKQQVDHHRHDILDTPIQSKYPGLTIEHAYLIAFISRLLYPGYQL